MAIGFRVVLAIHALLGAGIQVASGRSPMARYVVAHVPRTVEPTATVTSAPPADTCSSIQESVYTNSPRFPSDFASWYTTVFESMPPCTTALVPSSLVSLAAWWNCAGNDWSASHHDQLSSFTSQCSSWVSSSKAAFSASHTCFRYFEFDGDDLLACTSWLTQVTNTAPAPTSSTSSVSNGDQSRTTSDSGNHTATSTTSTKSGQSGSGGAAATTATKSTPSSAAHGGRDYLSARDMGAILAPAMLLSYCLM